MAAVLSDGRVQLREWSAGDAAWYAEESKDAEIQRFTSDPATLTAADVAQAILRMEAAGAVGFLISDASSGARLGNIAVDIDDQVGHVSYWVAAGARGRGVATAAIRLVGDWLLESGQVTELRLWTHEANVASQKPAVKAGFARDPERDSERMIKGEPWSTVAYRREL